MAEHRPYSEFRGGGTGALDAEDGNNLTAGDHSIVRREDCVAEYIVKSSSATENFPFVITPDTNPGTLRHHLVTQTGLLHSYKETADTVDEEMDSIGNFTVIAGSSGTANPLDTSGSTAIYDFASSPGSCLMQVGVSQSVTFRKSYTLADTESIILACSVGMIFDSTNSETPGIANGEVPNISLSLSDNSTYLSGNGTLIGTATGGTDRAPIRSYSLNSGSLSQVGTTIGIMPWVSKAIFLKIERASTAYKMWASGNGLSWNYMSTYTPSATSTYLHLAYGATSGAQTPNAIGRLFWLREGGNLLDPWPFL